MYKLEVKSFCKKNKELRQDDHLNKCQLAAYQVDFESEQVIWKATISTMNNF